MCLIEAAFDLNYHYMELLKLSSKWNISDCHKWLNIDIIIQYWVTIWYPVVQE